MMKNLLLSTALTLTLAGTAYAQSGSALEAMLQAGIDGMNADGANITFDQSEVGPDDSLTFTNLRIAPDDADVVIEADFITLTPSADTEGEITLTMSDVINLSGTPEAGIEPISIVIASTGFSLTGNWIEALAGSPSLALAADKLSVTGGDADHPILQKLLVAQENLELFFVYDRAKGTTEGALSMGMLTMDYVIGDPLEDITVSSQGSSESISVTFEGTGLPEDESQFEAFLANGTFAAVLENGPGSSTFLSNDSKMPVSLSAVGSEGKSEITLDGGDFRFAGVAGEVAYNITPNPALLPFPPFDVSLGGFAFDIAMPLSPSDETRDVRFLMDFNDLVVGESAWSLIDPQQTIPRDPATLNLDLSADVVLLTELSRADEIINPMEVARPEAVELNKLLLSVGGLLFTGEGAVELDTSGPIPVPNGSVDLSLSGAQTLADALVGLGLIEPLQVGMAMGMISAFAEPGDEPDSFNTTIEFKDGAILANGQLLQ